MQFVVHEASAAVDLKTIHDIEDQVFRSEKRIALPHLEEPPCGTVFRLIARSAENDAAAGALTVVESNADDPILRRHKNLVANSGRAVRYTRLAVLPQYRGQSLSTRLILEAQRRFVAPENIRYTWLLFDQARASSSLLSTLLGFNCGSAVIRSEYGPCRFLFREELSITAHNGNRRGWAYLAALAAPMTFGPEAAFLLSHPSAVTAQPAAASLPPAA
jgi:hypothetical protein